MYQRLSALMGNLLNQSRLYQIQWNIHADTLHVPADYSTIQAAIDVAKYGDTVLVAPGAYVENIDFKVRQSTLLGEQGAALTVIDGNQVGTVVTCKSGEGPASVMDGFTITNSNPTVINCTFTNNSYSRMYNLNSSPTVTNCNFNNNVAGFGGGMFNTSSCPTVINCNFTENGSSGIFDAGAGGGMCNWGNSNSTIINCALGIEIIKRFIRRCPLYPT